MHSTELGANTVPAFLTKLWKLVEDGTCDDLICWGPSGTSFIIRNQAQFAKELLPKYFKHNNMASFIRQLNMYGFRKVTNIEQGGLRAEKDEMEFQHQYFAKGQDYLLILIKRKIPTGKGNDEIKVRTEIVNRMLADMKQLKGNQENFDGKLQTMKRENEALWREVASLRQKHIKQQQIVNKLIHFLLTLVQPNHSIGMKRKIPLMFNENSHESKTPCLPRHLSYDGDKSCKTQNESAPSTHTRGPVIHEVTDHLDVGNVLGTDNVTEIVSTESMPSSSSMPETSTTSATATSIIQDPLAHATAEAEVPTVLDDFVSDFPLTEKNELPCSPAVGSDADASMNLPVTIESPSVSSENQGIDCNDETTTIPLDAALESVIGSDIEPLAVPLDSTNEVALFSANEPDYKTLKNEMSNHVENIQSELDTFRDLLSGSGYNFNASTLLGVCSGTLMSSLLDEAQLFGPDESFPNTSISEQGIGDDKNEITGTEVIQYNPTLLGLSEDDDLFGPDPSNSTVLFDNVEAILPDLDIAEELTTPDPLLSTPNFEGSKKRGRPKKTK